MKIGSLFSGVAGLDRAVEAVTGATPAWFVEFDPAPAKVLARHYPDVPNYGDITTVDWSQVEPVDIITGGFPCQDLSTAGLRKGLRPGTRSGLWEHMAYAINQLHPRLVVIENVRGLLSAEAHSDMEPCAWCLGDGSGSYMRALGAVLADLADLRYDARWCGVRASDAGAPHGRFRVFIIAESADADGGQFARPADRLDGLPVASERSLLPIPLVSDRDERRLAAPRNLLPTPVVNDMGNGKTPDDWDGWTADMQHRHGNGNGHGKSLAIEAQRLLPTPTSQAAKHGSTPDVTANGHGFNLWDLPTLLPTPTTQDATNVGGPAQAQRNTPPLNSVVVGSEWGQYAPAIQRWEHIIGEPAPPPTIQGAKGPRLNPDLPRWMMGFPLGWLDGLTPAQQLKAAGNAVCPQQCELALRILLGGAE